ncbi:MAG: DnaD domain protein, partial [Oscillospiraceae bacterium]|nr:DnaD domain protein [Oscillospiraceae bacterium]
CRTRGEIAAAREKLGRILRAEGAGAATEPLYPEDGPVQYGKEELASFAERESAFRALCDELAGILGTIPSQAYLNVLLDAYDHLGMPAEVIMQLIHYCDEETRRRWGSSRRPSAKAISDEAYHWARSEIMTLDLAEKYLSEREKRRSDHGRIAALLGIRGRELYKKEAEYIDLWLDMGFSDETIALALERTVMNTGGLKWAYLNGILRNWHAAGLHTVDEIEQAEGRKSKTPPRAGRGHGDPVDAGALADFMGE